MKMFKGIAFALALTLGACTNGQLEFPKPIDNPVGNNSLAAVESAYGITASASAAYMSLPLCKTNKPFGPSFICAKRSVKVQLKTAEDQAFLVKEAAYAFVKQNPKLDAYSVVWAAQKSIETWQAIQDANGIKR